MPLSPRNISILTRVQVRWASTKYTRIWEIKQELREEEARDTFSDSSKGERSKQLTRFQVTFTDREPTRLYERDPVSFLSSK